MGLIISLLAIGIMGAFFVFTVMRKMRHRCALSEFLPVSFLAGSAIAAYQLFWYYLAGVKYTLWTVSMAPFVFAASAVYFLAFRRNTVKGAFLPLKPFQGMILLEKLLLAGMVLQTAWIVFLVLPLPVHSHDAVANYALKARIFYFNGGIPAGFFSWPEAAVAHPDYPLFLPLLMTWIYEFIGFNDLWINVIMPVIYAAFLLLFYGLIKNFFSRTYSMLVVFLLATLPQLADYATLIHADLVLAVFVTCAFIYFMLYVRTMDRAHLALSSVLFGFSLWVKNEAVVFVSAFVLALSVFTLRQSGKSRGKAGSTAGILTALGLIAVIAAPWFAVKAAAGAVNSDINLAELTAARIWRNVKDIPILLDLFQQQVFGPKKWNIFWILVAGCAVWKRKYLWKGEIFYATLFLLVSSIGYFAGYMCTTGNNLFFYVNTTISRFMLHFSGISMFFLASLVYEDVSKDLGVRWKAAPGCSVQKLVRPK